MRRSPLRSIAAAPAAAAAAVTLATALALAAAGPALAHVTVDPATTPGGGYTKVSFRVPSESDAASTTRVQVFFPADHPFGSVAVQPTPGWSYRVVDTRLKKPITTDDGQVSQAVTRITWTASSRRSALRPGQFQDFNVSLGPLPDSGAVVFKVLQTYSDGRIARWIDPPVAGQAEPERPAPTLTLTPAGASASDGAMGSSAGSGDDSRSTWALGLSGLAVVIAAGGAVTALRRTGA